MSVTRNLLAGAGLFSVVSSAQASDACVDNEEWLIRIISSGGMSSYKSTKAADQDWAQLGKSLYMPHATVILMGTQSADDAAYRCHAETWATLHDIFTAVRVEAAAGFNDQTIAETTIKSVSELATLQAAILSDHIRKRMPGTTNDQSNNAAMQDAQKAVFDGRISGSYKGEYALRPSGNSWFATELSYHTEFIATP